MNKLELASNRKLRLELDTGLLEWLPLHPFGAFVGNGINVTFDASSLADILAQLEAQPTGWPVDYHHATVKVEEGKQDKAPRAAQIVAVEVRDGYVYGQAADWVQSALESVKAGEFGFTSSVLYLDDASRVIGYHSHALTNKPGTYSQRKIGLEAHATDAEFIAEMIPHHEAAIKMAREALPSLENATIKDIAATILTTQTLEIETMKRVQKTLPDVPMGKSKKMSAMEDGMDWIKKLLGLELTATDEQVKLALEGITAKAKLGEFVVTTLALEGAPDATANRARVLKLVALEGTADEVGKLRLTLEAQNTRTAEESRESVVKLALEDGRIFEPEAALWRKHLTTDFAAGKLALEAMPKRVPVTTPTTQSPERKLALEGDAAKISKLLGVTAEMLEKGDK